MQTVWKLGLASEDLSVAWDSRARRAQIGLRLKQMRWRLARIWPSKRAGEAIKAEALKNPSASLRVFWVEFFTTIGRSFTYFAISTCGRTQKSHSCPTCFITSG